MSTSVNDLGYCRGARAEKVAMLEANFKKVNQRQSSTPDLSVIESSASKAVNKDLLKPAKQARRRTHSEDIRQRMRCLEDAWTKTNYTRDEKKPMSKSDPNYGKPQQGSLTAARGEKAHTHVHKVRT